jgi:hypothetical protein
MFINEPTLFVCPVMDAKADYRRITPCFKAALAAALRMVQFLSRELKWITSQHKKMQIGHANVESERTRDKLRKSLMPVCGVGDTAHCQNHFRFVLRSVAAPADQLKVVARSGLESSPARTRYARIDMLSAQTSKPDYRANRRHHADPAGLPLTGAAHSAER